MNVIDTFLFCEPYETELLLVKLNLEFPFVQNFVLIESDCTFRGDYKGLHAKKLIQSDSRFDKFRDKITIIEHQGRLLDGEPKYKTYYENEERSRALALDFIKTQNENSWVFVSDVDECLDASDPVRLSRFQNYLEQNSNKGKALYFGHYRYWYDFDNYCCWNDIFTPVVQAKDLISEKISFRLRSFEHFNNLIIRPENEPIFFEYTFCFNKEGVWKKLNSFIHDGYTKEEAELSLLTNHWVKAKARGEYPGQRGKEDWFEKVELTEQNSPKFVRDNLEKLKTNIIPLDYKEHRKRIYGV